MALQHRQVYVAARALRTWYSHAKQMKWERARLHRANTMHDQLLLERCVRHLMQLGQARLTKYISSEVGRQTAAFSQDLMIVAPFAMRWLLVTRRYKTIRSYSKFRNSPSSVHAVKGQENVNSENHSQDVVRDRTSRAVSHKQANSSASAAVPGVPGIRDACQRRQVCYHMA